VLEAQDAVAHRCSFYVWKLRNRWLTTFS
jgi:hypothetical protein